MKQTSIIILHLKGNNRFWFFFLVFAKIFTLSLYFICCSEGSHEFSYLCYLKLCLPVFVLINIEYSIFLHSYMKFSEISFFTTPCVSIVCFFLLIQIYYRLHFLFHTYPSKVVSFVLLTTYNTVAQ